MRVARSLIAGGISTGLILGCLLLGSGCGDSSSGGGSDQVKDAPLPPDQQKQFDAYYKTPKKKK